MVGEAQEYGEELHPSHDKCCAHCRRAYTLTLLNSAVIVGVILAAVVYHGVTDRTTICTIGETDPGTKPGTDPGKSERLKVIEVSDSTEETRISYEKQDPTVQEKEDETITPPELISTTSPPAVSTTNTTSTNTTSENSRLRDTRNSKKRNKPKRGKKDKKKPKNDPTPRVYLKLKKCNYIDRDVSRSDPQTLCRSEVVDEVTGEKWTQFVTEVTVDGEGQVRELRCCSVTVVYESDET